METRTLKKEKDRSWLGILFGLLLAVVVLVGMRSGFIHAEHYRRVYQKPLEVEAVVAYHEVESDSEGSDDYLSYLSYTVNGVKYTGVLYENKGSKSSLTPVGTQVTIQVSPENPGKTLSSIRKKAANTIYFTFAILFVSISLLLKRLITRGQTKGMRHKPDSETVERDARLQIWGDFRWKLYLLVCVGLGVMCLYYPMIFKEDAAQPIMGISAVLLVIRSVKLCRMLGCLKRQEYRLMRNELINKSVHEDSDSGTTYTLQFGNEQGSWSKNVSLEVFNRVEVGQAVYALYFSEQDKKPFLHYDENGDCCQ